MKKLGILLLAALISMGLVAVMGGCGGGGGGGESLPKSSPTYSGPNNPAVIDSLVADDFFMVPWSIDQLISELDLITETGFSAVMETSETLDGTIGGTVTVWARMSTTDTATKYTYKEEMKITFMNFEDDGSTFDSVLTGDGSAYLQYKEVGTASTYSELYHQNYDALSFSDAVDDQDRSGWMTLRFSAQDEPGLPWQNAFDANIAMRDYVDDFSLALLDAEADIGWDGSFTTYSGKGTVCAEGNSVWGDIGCFDIVFDMMWAEESPDGSPIEDYPMSGSFKASTINAGIMYTYGTSASDYTCYKVSVDEDGDKVYELEQEICGGT